MRPLARPYLQHGSRHAKTGSDPTPGSGIDNDWVFGQIALGTVNAGTDVNGSMVGAIAHQTDDGSVYGEGTGVIHTINMLQVGSYIVKVTVSFQQGKIGYVEADAVIGGPCTTYPYEDFNQPFDAASLPDTTGGTDMGKYGGYVTWAQLCVVHDLSAPTGAYIHFTNQTTSNLVGTAGYMHIFRLT